MNSKSTVTELLFTMTETFTSPLQIASLVFMIVIQAKFAIFKTFLKILSFGMKQCCCISFNVHNIFKF